MPQREVDYQWHLAELMARHQMHNTTALIEPLRTRGINLSESQVYRLVVQRPERLSLKVLAALCDIFECEPMDLITTTSAAVDRRRAAANSPDVVPLTSDRRIKRARIVDER
jgi:DNA-binding Xre family transcriptional regulator